MPPTLLRGQLQTIKNNYALVQAGIMFLVQPDAKERFDDHFSVVAHHPEAKDFGYIRYVLETDELLVLATNQLRKSVLRGCLKEMFEVLKAYGLATDQIKIIRAAPWYQFLRMTRNSLSHDFFIQYRDHDLRLLPVSWSGLTFTAAMNGTEFPMAGFLSRAKVIELIDDVISYVETHVA
jgi:hypothetical protein